MRLRSFNFGSVVPNDAIINGAQIRLFARADGLGVQDFQIICSQFEVVLNNAGALTSHDVGYPLTRITDENM